MAADVREMVKPLRSIEYELASRSFVDFLDHVWIMEPPPGAGKIRFAKWDYLVEIAELLGAERLIVILKSRQLGFSWIMAAYACWTLRFKGGSVVLMLSRGQNESHALLDKVRFVYKSMPESWQLPLGTDSRSELAIPLLYSKVMALPSTEDAGRSETATVVIQDEADFHLELEANFSAVKPTIDAGGQLIMGSTSNKRSATSLFKALYKQSPDNGWAARFYGWGVRPGRNQDWYDRTRASVPELVEAQDMGPDLYMEQEYPRTSDEALAPPRSVAAFDHDVLKGLEQFTQKPLLTIGPINIYRKWKMGRRYMAGTDVSHGVGLDEGVTVLIDTESGYTCADIKANNLSPEELAYQSIEMLKLYKNPIWGIEDNEWGIIVIKDALTAQYPQLYYREHKSKKKTEKMVGWHTDERSRYVLWGQLIEAVNAGLITITNASGLSQLYSVIRNPKKEGRIEAQQGSHDDYPIALGIAWQMRKHAYASGGKMLQIPARY